MQSRTPEEIYQAFGKVPANAMTKEERSNKDMKNSDRACCYTCNNFYYDMKRGEYCKVTNRLTKPWNDCDCGAHTWTRTAGE